MLEAKTEHMFGNIGKQTAYDTFPYSQSEICISVIYSVIVPFRMYKTLRKNMQISIWFEIL
jgi:hypothetical protein